MGHLYLTTNLYGHPAINQAGNAPLVVWVSSLCWMNANSRDGSIPKSEVREILRRLGTNHDETNFQTLCRPCNSSKGARI